MPDFKLSAQLRGHDADVRSVCFPSPQAVVSASRDHTVRIWRRTSTSPPKFEASITQQAHAYVNSLAFLRPSTEYPDGLILSGGQDSLIEVRKPTATPTDNAERLLIGHSHNVCALDVSPKGLWAVSGGWDGQCRVWSVSKWETELELKHESADAKSVWAVLALDENTVITGSADENIRIFDLRRNNAGLVTPRATIPTTSVVRSLCKLPTGIKGHPSGADFASATNDGIIRLWKLSGQQVGELRGHDSYIYSLGCLPSGEIVSSGEDRTVRVWNGSQCVQTITHPAISVWSVAVCAESGDIVSGASDNMVRVFSRSPDRVADAETLAQFDDSVKASAIPQQQLNQTINKEKLDTPDWLKVHSGNKDGQVKMIREDDASVSAHQWSASEQKWIAVGTVVDSAGSSGRKVEYQGKEYDFVFDVDIEDGKPPLKLPYNLSENPYDRATRFLGDNELPISYLDSVANFIVENTKGATIGQESQGTTSDPFGTESRYKPGDTSSTPAKKRYLPHDEYITLTQAKFEPIQKKIQALNAALLSNGNKDHALNPSEEKVLASLVQTLSTNAATIDISPEAIALVLKLTTQWPPGDRLPGLDLLRVMVARSAVAASLTHPRHGSAVATALWAAGLTAADAPAGATAPSDNSAMMALRVATNIFATPEGRDVAARDASTVVAALERITGVAAGVEPIGRTNRNVQIAATSAAFNYAVLARTDTSGAVSPDALALLSNVLGRVLRDQADSEVLYRALMALGTVVADHGDARDTAKTLGAEEWVRGAVSKANEVRVREVGAECLAYMR